MDIDDNQKDNNNRTVDINIMLSYKVHNSNFADIEDEEEIGNSSNLKAITEANSF
ncbi:hypothetical protein QTP88_028603 [Uroleucon formosanum]